MYAATTVTIGNGERANFWSSRWLQGEAPATVYPTLFKHSKRKNRSVKDALTGNKWVTGIREGNKCLEEVVPSTWQALRAGPGVS